LAENNQRFEFEWWNVPPTKNQRFKNTARSFVTDRQLQNDHAPTSGGWS
jgi:hypothetical protein